jgi:tRNA pseudouridine55 synthase
LRRTKSGRFTLRDAVPLRKLRESFDTGTWYQYLIPAAEALSDWPAIDLSKEQVESIRHGIRIQSPALPSTWARGINDQGELVALLEFDPATGEWQPKKVFFS